MSELNRINQENNALKHHIKKLQTESEMKANSESSVNLKESIEIDELVLILMRVRKDNNLEKLKILASKEQENDDLDPFQSP